MPRFPQIDRLLAHTWRRQWFGVTLVLLILAGTISATTRQLRRGIREQILARDGAVLQAVACTQLEDETLAGPADGPPDLLAVVLVTSRLRGVIAARLLDEAGRFVDAFPVAVREADVAPADLAVLRGLQPVVRLHSRMDPGALFYPDPAGARGGSGLPVLEVNVPLHRAGEGRLLGVGQFLIEGHTVAGELARLDERLLLQAVAAFLLTGAIIAAVMSWASGRLRRANRLLGERTSLLLRANQELALAVRTNALGSLASHLIHGLKSPLTGLQQFVAEAARAEKGAAPGDWEQAAASARRMQTLIHDVVNVLREEETSTQYELSLAELCGVVLRRAEPVAQGRGVRVTSRVEGDAVLDNRNGNLLGFILVNLLENGIQATAHGGEVRLLARGGPPLIFEVADGGPGFPEAWRADPFAPRPSTKEGGSGIGLSISRQLALHLGAELTLHRTSPEGSVFQLRLALPAGSGST